MPDKIHQEMPVGGKRARLGSGRGRSIRLSIRLSPSDGALLRALAEDYGVTYTEVIERGIRLVAAASPPLRPRPAEAEGQNHEKD